MNNKEIKRSCDFCLNSRPIASENGIHFICGLSARKARTCILNGKYFICKPFITKDPEWIAYQKLSYDIKFDAIKKKEENGSGEHVCTENKGIVTSTEKTWCRWTKRPTKKERKECCEMRMKKFCKYHGDTISSFYGVIRCKRDGSVRKVGEGCSIKCPHYRPSLLRRIRKAADVWGQAYLEK